MKYIKLLTIVLLLCFVSCDDELQKVNENPNDPTSVPIDRLFIKSQKNLSNEFVITSFDLTNRFVNYSEYPLRQWDFFLTQREAGADWWLKCYEVLKDIELIIASASAGDEDFKGTALVIKSWIYYTLTSFYGDIPNTQATQALEGINLPAYDRQEDVFNSILANLVEANNLLGTGNFPLNGDFLLGNNALKWKKFANSLRVRVLIAQSKKVDPSSQLQTIISNPSTYPLMESNADQPTFNFVDEAIYPRNKEGLFFINDVYMGKDFIDKLLEFNDERIKIFASKASTPMPNDYAGIASGTKTNPGTSVSKSSNLIFESRDNHAIQAVWMQYSELQFLLAEAAESGWISGGTLVAQNYYNKGIQASYEYQKERLDLGIFMGQTQLNPMAVWNPNYLSQVGVVYTGSQTQKLNLIAIQKWIALYNDMESYFSWRRNQLPSLNFDPAGVNNGMPPLRFNYPLDEKIFNTQNYNNVLAIQGADEWITKMWLLK